MSTHPFVRAIAIFFAVVFIVPSAFFVAPPKARAWSDIPAFAQRVITIVQNTLIEADVYITEVAMYADYINTYVLQPLAFVLSGNLMKALTASVVKFVSGQSNGTGAPQFTTNLAKTLQTLSDVKVQMYLKQISLTKSPFASSISAALSNNYLQSSSLGGFWAANTCTLSKSSPNVSAYLAGNWSQGGVSAWFALTTQSQNNPYMLYQNSQAQLANVVGGAVAARTSEINWGSGFMSWCSVSDSATQTQNAASTAYQTCMANGGNGDTCQATFENSGGLMTAVGINPGDACTNSDGSSGVIQTPGSTIKATLDKVLGGQQDKLAAMGNISSQITDILGKVGSIIQTVNFASNILGGTGMGGLLNAGQPSGSLARFAPTTDASGNFTSGYGVITGSSIDAAASSSPVAGATDTALTTRVDLYTTGWKTIGDAAVTAQTSVTSLMDTCTQNVAAAKVQLPSTNFDDKATLQAFIDAASSWINAAQTALAPASMITTVSAQAAQAPVVATAILDMNKKVKGEMGTSAYAADLKTLQAMPPTSDDVTYAQKNMQTTPVDSTVAASIVANPPGSLVVSGGTLVDQMTLISTNAAALETTVCGYPALGGGGGNGGM